MDSDVGAPGRTRIRRRSKPTGTRASLLEAAGALFGEFGYDGTTVREIADRAGVDQALIVRYFGCKAELYHEAVEAGFNINEFANGTQTLENLALQFVMGIDEEGVPPALRALLQLPVHDEARATASEKFERLALAPIEEALRARQVAEPRLVAETVAAFLIGVVLMRRSATFGKLAAIEPRWIASLIDSIGDVAPGSESPPPVDDEAVSA